MTYLWRTIVLSYKQNQNFITFFLSRSSHEVKNAQIVECLKKIMKLANTRIMFNNSSGFMMTLFIARQRTGITPYYLNLLFELILFKTEWCSMYQVNIYTIVSFHCVEIIVLLFTRVRDHCCVLSDVTLDCYSLDI